MNSGSKFLIYFRFSLFSYGLVFYIDFSRVLPADEIAERARVRIGEKGYHVLFNNCENFATEC
jgi:hypothetical protein